MIATITLNPAIDIRYNLPDFHLDGVNRVTAVDKTAGGKGLNVSRVLSQLGANVTCTGFLGGKSGEWIADQLPNYNLINRFVGIKGETRFCLVIESKEGHTEILEQGPEILENEREEFLKNFDTIIESNNYIVGSGSLPYGIDSDFYRDLIEKTKQKGKYFLLDSSGESLAHGIKGKPFLIKPNREEFCKLIGLNQLSIEDMIWYAQDICQKGTQYVLLSLGKEGALLVSKDVTLQAVIPALTDVHQVGSGDSMLAGFTFAHSKGYSIEDILKWSCACGISNAASERTGSVELTKVQHYFNLIKVKELTGGDQGGKYSLF
ncbi:1-phosphofructokinase family hexose kinase [Bacillus sp. AFS053548]|uniref:1-phosphofructokinase family hexose kinase n=1 Tax=Bacillus sp. AFS053548 TaxID=2033505 RepID=UPI000BFD1DA7|nr:1-phosphofructokinase family hexose kinase [Bacillus sp. AFS053548]PGM59291.1 1-phosphofructokinase [Bacillus sp. AFS053548]